jgi:hypothetical protein
MLGGPGIINGQITMNGLGNAVIGVGRDIGDLHDFVDQRISDLKNTLNQISAALNKISAEQAKQAQTLFAIQQNVDPALKRIVKTHAPAVALHG